MSCADKIKDKSTFGEVSPQSNKAEMENCVNKCSDEMIKILPTFSKKIREYFNKQYYLKWIYIDLCILSREECFYLLYLV